MKVSNMHFVLAALVVVLLLAVGALVLRVGPFGPSGVGVNPDQNDQSNPKGSVRLVLLSDSSCAKCVALDGVESALTDQNLVISRTQQLDYQSSEGAVFVSQYTIARVPAVIMIANAAAVPVLSKGFSSRGTLQTGETVFVYDDPPPVFVDVATKKVRGIVDVVVLFDSNCSQCRKPLSQAEVASAGLIVGDFALVDLNSVRGAELVSRYKLTRVPSVVFSSEASLYTAFLEKVALSNPDETDGSFVLRDYPPVYYDLVSKRLVGITHLVLLGASACKSCYDVNIHVQVLQTAFGVMVNTPEYVDAFSAQGKKLASDDNISKVPTMILSGDVNAYAGLLEAWPDLGFVAPDGALVFSEFEAMGGDLNIFDLDQNKMVLITGASAS
ncbi:MAG: hypothetical protein Q7R47_06555 [Candidatus Diapherotrites archaeon]|nr:hypothetical protein [Candidatus Diapherotrites archaeon]